MLTTTTDERGHLTAVPADADELAAILNGASVHCKAEWRSGLDNRVFALAHMFEQMGAYVSSHSTLEGMSAPTFSSRFCDVLAPVLDDVISKARASGHLLTDMLEGAREVARSQPWAVDEDRPGA